MHVLVEFPREHAERPLEALGVPCKACVACRLLELSRMQRLVPLVVDRPIPFLQEHRAILVLHDQPLVKATGRVVGVDVHLADVDAVISVLRQRPHPGRFPRLEIAEDLAPMGVLAGEQARPGTDAHRRRDEAMGERRPFPRQPVQVRCVHPGRTERADRVRPLLVGHEQDDVRSCGIGHVSRASVPRRGSRRPTSEAPLSGRPGTSAGRPRRSRRPVPGWPCSVPACAWRRGLRDRSGR